MKYFETQDYRIKKRGKKYYARFTCAGIPVHESLHTENFGVAKRLVDEIEKKILLGEYLVIKSRFFGECWPAFITELADENRTSTINAYEHTANKYYIPFFKDIKVDKINDELFRQFVEWCRIQSSDLNKFENHRKYLNRFLSWCKKKKYILEKPLLHNPDKKFNKEVDFDDNEDDGPGKNFSNNEIHTLLTNSRDKIRLAILMAFLMGMRKSEITQLAKNRINLEKRTISLRKVDTKTKKERTFPIHPEVYDALLEQYNATDSNYLFPNAKTLSRPMSKDGFSRAWKDAKALERKGNDIIKSIEGRFHDLRHSFLTRAFANETISPLLICEYAGLSIDVAQRVYLHFDLSDLLRVHKAVSLEGIKK